MKTITLHPSLEKWLIKKDLIEFELDGNTLTGWFHGMVVVLDPRRGPGESRAAIQGLIRHTIDWTSLG